LDGDFVPTMEAMLVKAKAARAAAQAKYDAAAAALRAANARLEAVEHVMAMHAEPVRKRTGRRAENAENADAILSIVRDANSVGLLSSQIVAELKERGVDMNVTSAGMYLSKLKAAGRVEQIGRNWRVPQNQEPPDTEAPGGPESQPAPNGAGHIEDPYYGS